MLVVPALTVAPLIALVDERVARPAMIFAIGGIATGAAWLAGWWSIPAARQSIAAALCAMTLTAFAAELAPHSQPDWDFINAYQLPADRFQAGVDPWKAGETTNPPTYAQTLGIAHAAVGAVAPAATHERAWFWVFYLHQVVQQWLLAAMLVLLMTLTRRAGLSMTAAATISATLMLLNDPLRET